jgi:predicted small metal-binding protein
MAGYSFRCKDIGMKCDFEVKGASSKDEAMQLAGVHAKMAHGVTSLPPELANKVSAAIKG